MTCQETLTYQWNMKKSRITIMVLKKILKMQVTKLYRQLQYCSVLLQFYVNKSEDRMF